MEGPNDAIRLAGRDTRADLEAETTLPRGDHLLEHDATLWRVGDVRSPRGAREGLSRTRMIGTLNAVRDVVADGECAHPLVSGAWSDAGRGVLDGHDAIGTRSETDAVILLADAADDKVG